MAKKSVTPARTPHAEKLAVYEVTASMVQVQYEFVGGKAKANKPENCYKRAGDLITANDFGAPELEQHALEAHALRLLARVRPNELTEWLADYRAMKEGAKEELAVPA